jgi:SAM-dependent methyltransferase
MEPLNLLEKFSGLKIEELEVLDVGCGHMNSPLSTQMRKIPFKKLVALDIAAPGVRDLITNQRNIAAKELQAYVRDARTYLPSLPTESYDVVIMMDMLEHVTKDEGLELLSQAKRIARKKVLIWLPVGPCDQKGTEDNPAMAHEAVWTPPELEAQGFTVTTWSKFHQHIYPPADAAWAIWKNPAKKKSKQSSLSA